MNQEIDVLVPHARANPTWDSEKARELFEGMITNGLAYDELSKHANYLSYASVNNIVVVTESDGTVVTVREGRPRQ